MSQLSSKELEDFIKYQIEPESVARRYIYDKLRENGLSHEDALAETLVQIKSIKSESIPKEQLQIIKEALLKGAGKFID